MKEKHQENEIFADLFKDESTPKKQPLPGEKIKAEIVAISSDSVFLDIGEKSEGYLDPKELQDEEGNVTVAVGDTLEVYFLSSSRNEMLFTTKIGGGSSSREHLEQAYHSGVPVEGLVKKEIKGGFEVTVAGTIRTFCPYSQMEIKRISDPEKYVGEHMLFKIMEYRENGRNIILSRRKILEEEREAQREELKESLHEGTTVSGKITSLREFGAFVDIGGVEGLIPMSEIGWGQVSSIHDVLSEGQEVEVVVMKTDWENDRFSFSLKQALPDPWDDIHIKLPVGSEQEGTVVRLTKFGAFINLAPGIDGLIHISKLGGGRKINHPREVVEEGQAVTVKIEEIDTENKRISLAPVSQSPDDTDEPEHDTEDYQHYLQQQPTTSSSAKTGTLGDILQQKLKEKEQQKKS